eukprot:jgi/Mesen1/5498/ME000276S04630
MGRTGCAASPRKALQVREYSDENRDPEGSHSYAGDGKLQPAEPQQKHNETCPTSSKGHRLFERFQFAMDLIAKVVEREHKIRELDLLQKVGLLQGETEARESMLTAANASVKELQQKLQAVTAEGHVLTQRVADLAEALSISQAEVEREAVLSKELESKVGSHSRCPFWSPVLSSLALSLSLCLGRGAAVGGGWCVVGGRWGKDW